LRPLSRTRFLVTNANPAWSCVYICKFQFRPIHPPLGDFQRGPGRARLEMRERRGKGQVAGGLGLGWAEFGLAEHYVTPLVFTSY
jgi:hypothetical protein